MSFGVLKRFGPRACAALVVVCATFSASAAPILDQLDNFQDGTTQEWGHGIASQLKPTNVAMGGPAGAGDRFLQAVSTGNAGADGRAVILNQGPRWTGSFPASIAAVEMDLRNFGATSLQMRLAFRDSFSNQFAS